MTRKPVFRSQADQEVRSARHWYEEQRPELGIQFASAIDEAVERIAANPLAFPAVHGETRRAVVRPFPYGIYFRVLADEIVVRSDARPPASTSVAIALVRPHGHQQLCRMVGLTAAGDVVTPGGHDPQSSDRARTPD